MNKFIDLPELLHFLISSVQYYSADLSLISENQQILYVGLVQIRNICNTFTTNMLKAYLSTQPFTGFYAQQDSLSCPTASWKTAQCKVYGSENALFVFLCCSTT